MSKTKKLSFLAGVLLFVILATGSVGGSGGSSSKSTSTSSGSKFSEKTEEKAEEPEEEKMVGDKAGMYKVGSDIPAGIYIVFSDGGYGGYYERNSNSEGGLDSIISNDNFDTFTYVKIKDGEYLKLSGSYAVPEAEYKDSLAKDGIIGPGTYKVGKDIEAGEYKVTAEEDSGYWERFNIEKDSLSRIIKNDFFEGNAYVTVKDGEYFKLSNSTAEKATKK